MAKIGTTKRQLNKEKKEFEKGAGKVPKKVQNMLK